MTTQTTTPYHLCVLPEKQALVEEFVGKPIDSLRTPAMVIDRAIFAKNCASMHQNAKDMGAKFRAHLKTHKTVEGARLQLISSVDKTEAVVVSTLMEAWQVVKAGLVADGTVKDILYGLPVAINKIDDLSALWDNVVGYGGIIRLLIDHPDQVRHLEMYESCRVHPRRWSVFVKVDSGQRRAGVPPDSPSLKTLLSALLTSPAISVHGFYAHAGNSYGATSLTEAAEYLSSEVEAANSAAEQALAILSCSQNTALHRPFVLSVGSTPTAHAASTESKKRLTSLINGELELHAGNYPMLDLQQKHTSLIDSNRISQRVVATVISYYPGRGEGGTDEAMCDAGAIALSKDIGPSGGHGNVIGYPWMLGRISQEHGILTRIPGTMDEAGELSLGSRIDIVGQHACLIAAAYPWYYIVDSGGDSGKREVVDVWVPWKGW